MNDVNRQQIVRRWTGTWPVALIGLGLACPAAGQLQPPSPRIECEPPELDLGVTEYGDSSSGSFRIWNRGDATLEIRELIKECGCTTAELLPAQRRIEPGESALIQVALRPTRPEHRSVFRRTIKLITNDPQHPEIDYALFCTVHAAIRVQPDTITIVNVVAGETLRERIVVSATDDRPFTIIGVDVPEVTMWAELRRGTPDVRHQIDLVIDTAKAAGNIYKELVIRTSNARMREIKVPVQVQVIPLVAVSPPMIHLGSVWPGTTVRRPVQLTPAPGRTLETVEFSVERYPQMRVAAVRVPDAPHVWEVEFAVPLELAGKVLASRVAVKSNLDREGNATGFNVGARVKPELDLAPGIPAGPPAGEQGGS